MDMCKHIRKVTGQLMLMSCESSLADHNAYPWIILDTVIELYKEFTTALEPTIIEIGQYYIKRVNILIYYIRALICTEIKYR
jgi:hypothetical protein